MEYTIIRANSDKEYLAHHGIKGQKWGVRRFENPDGSLTVEGKIRYAEAERKAKKYRSPGNRIAKVATAGIFGAVLGTAVGGLALGGIGTAIGSGAIKALLYSAAEGALASAGATALVQGVHAGKVRRDMNFVNKMQQSIRNTNQANEGQKGG